MNGEKGEKKGVSERVKYQKRHRRKHTEMGKAIKDGMKKKGRQMRIGERRG